MDIKHSEGVKAATINLQFLKNGAIRQTVEPGQPPMKGWHLAVEGLATIKVGDDLVVSGPIVSIDEVAGFTYENKAIGLLEGGMHPSGVFNQWVFQEAKNGVLNVPYSVINGQLFMGIFPEKRIFVTENGTTVQLAGIPGGFGESSDPKVDALRELFEETGIIGVEIFPMEDPMKRALPDVVSNRAFMVDTNGKNGQLFFGLYIPPEKLVADDLGFHMEIDQLPEVVETAPKARIEAAKALRNMTTLSFVPVAQIGLYARDLMVLGGLARLRSLFDLGLLPQQQTLSKDYSFLSDMGQKK